jgi:hypothetical protein
VVDKDKALADALAKVEAAKDGAMVFVDVSLKELIVAAKAMLPQEEKWPDLGECKPDLENLYLYAFIQNPAREGAYSEVRVYFGGGEISTPAQAVRICVLAKWAKRLDEAYHSEYADEALLSAWEHMQDEADQCAKHQRRGGRE